MKRDNILYIGIDPAFREKGIGFCEILNGVATFRQYSFTQLMNKVYQKEFSKAIVCIENSYLQNCSFDLSGTKAAVARKSRNVGMNQATSKFICDAFQFNCLKHYEISPLGKGEKLGQKQLLEMAKRYKVVLPKGRLNQDKRDALKIAILGYNKYQMQIRKI